MNCIKLFYLVVLSLMAFLVACSGNSETKSIANDKGNIENTETTKEDINAEEVNKGQEQILINWGTAAPSSSYYPFHAAVINSVNKYSSEHLNNQIQVTMIDSEGTDENLKLLMDGRIQIAQSVTPTDYNVYHGKGSFEGNAWKDIRTLFVTNVAAYVPVVRVDSGVNSLVGLNGKPFATGGTGAASTTLTQAAFETLGIEPEYYRGGIGDAFQSVKDNEIVGVLKGAGSPTRIDSGIEELSVTTDIKPLSWTEEQIDEIKKKYPHYQYVTIPAGIYPNQDQEIIVQGLYVDYTTTKDLSAETAYNILKGAFENKQLHVDVFDFLSETDYGELTMEAAQAPLHPGAVKFFEERGYEIPEHLIPSEN